MKATTTAPRASHVNSGTSIPREELAWPDAPGRVFRLPKTHIEVDARSEVTPFGGLALFTAFVRRFDVADVIDEAVRVLKLHLPYHEADHVLALAANLFVGGTCLEDLMHLQHSEAARRLLGAVRLPDPTTAGDFLRRFQATARPGALAALRRAVDVVGGRVGRACRRRRGKQPVAHVDLDGHIKEVYGVRKEGADFGHDGRWSYQPLLVTLAETGEWLAVRNRPGGGRASDSAAEVLDEILPRLKERFDRVVVRGDSDFDRADIRAVCRRHGAYFAIVGREHTGRPDIAKAIPETAYRRFRPRAWRQAEVRARKPGYRARARKPNRRRRKARERGFRELRLVEHEIAEVPYLPSDGSYRLIVRRQRIEHHRGQQYLFDDYRYRYVVTDEPGPAEQAIDDTYQRCDQENIIAELGRGLAAWRMPVAEFDGNSAWLEIARLAWNIGKWIALLTLPPETSRWEWKRFRLAFIYVAAHVLRRSRQVTLRISASHRFHRAFLHALERLQT